MRFTGPEVQDDATKAMLIARAMKQEDAISPLGRPPIRCSRRTKQKAGKAKEQRSKNYDHMFAVVASLQ